ncbi:MAG: hypothetical protein ACYS8Z_04400 [Planctomycetota bacterium]
MEASKCPIAMLWFVLGIGVYRLTPDQTAYIEDCPGGQDNLPNLEISPCHIRPPPKQARIR